MLDKIKKYLKEKKIIRKKRKIYNFSDDEQNENKKLRKVSFLDRIKFIKFNNKKDDKNTNIDIQRIKEIRFVSDSCSSYWNRLY